MYNSLAWWQHLLNFILGAMLLIGFVSIFIGLKRRRSQHPSTGTNVMIGIFLILLGGIARAILAPHLKAPIDAPKEVEETKPDHIVNSETQFRSALPPAVSVIAPEGWKVFEAAGNVAVLKGDNLNTVLRIDSNLMEERTDLGSMREAMKQVGDTNANIQMEEPGIETTLGGQAALRTTQRLSTGEAICSWWVIRGNFYASNVICSVDDGQDACGACKSVVDTIEWIRPFGIQERDLAYP